MTNNKMYTVSESDMIDILNRLTYEDYAKLQRALWRAGIKRRPYFTEYIHECTKYDMYKSISTEAWYAGYSFIVDLFEDNERFGTPCDEEARMQRSIDEVLILINRRH